MNKNNEDIYLGLPPKKAYLEYSIKIWKTSTLFMLQYMTKDEIENEQLDAYKNNVYNLEKIVLENSELEDKHEDVLEVKKHMNTYVDNLKKENKTYTKQEEQELMKSTELIHEILFMRD